MALSFGASQGAAAPAYQTYNPSGAMTSDNPYTSLIGAGLGLASQFNPNTPGLAPGSTQSQLPSWMSGQWQNAFNAQNTAAAQAQVSPFTQAQQQAMQNIQNSVGYQMPAIQQAQATAGNLAQGVGAQQIQNFMSPYQQSAIQGTLNTMEQQRQQQDANINSQANAAGAWGGDRSAVANNLNDQSWNLSEGNVIGNMENSGYQNAVQSALGNQAAQLAGNQQFSNVIGQNINANTAQNQNLLTIGNQQQAQNQNVANLPFLRSQVIGQNLNPNVGGQQGYAQNPVTGAIAGLQSGLQLGNGINQLLGGNNGTAGFGAAGQIANQALGYGANAGGISGEFTGNTNDPTYYNANQQGFVNSADNNLQQFELPSYSDQYTPPGYFSGAGGQAANLGEMTAGVPQYTDNAAVAGYSTAPSLGDPGMADVNGIQQPNFNISSGGSSGMSGAGQALSGAGNAMNIYQGLQRGGVSGYGSAALNAATLAAKTGVLPSAAAQYIGPAGNVLGLYNGIKSGTTSGYINAASNAAVLGETGAIMGTTGAGLGAASAAAGIAALPLAVAAYGASKPAYTLDASWWGNFNNNLKSDYDQINNIGQVTPLTSQQIAKAQFNEAQGLQSLVGMNANAGGQDMLPSVSTSEWQQLAQYGITPQNINQVQQQLQNESLNGPGSNWVTGGAYGGGGSKGTIHAD